MSVVGYDHLQQDVDNPDPQVNSPSEKLALGTGLAGAIGDRYVIVMVGVPGSGKTYVSRRISQYLQFFHGSETEVFNVGEYRRNMVGAKSPHSFFDVKDEKSMALRNACAEKAMEDLKKWLQKVGEPPRVAFYDASNVTRERRSWILAQLEPILESSGKAIFVECMSNTEELSPGTLAEIKGMPDYKDVDEKDAVDDYRERIKHYRAAYEPLDATLDMSVSWIKIVDDGQHISMNRIAGFLPGRIVQFLMNMNTKMRPIYLSRHGQSMYNVQGKIGGDSLLSESGEAYAEELAKYVHTEILGLNPDGSFKDPEKKTAPHARLFTSTLRRTKLTARHITHQVCDDGWIIMRPRECSALDEIYAGVFDGMTYEEIQLKAPSEFQERKADKLAYRYPRGESYLDVIQRLDAIVHEVERQRDPVLIVGHQGILRILYSYFMGDSRESAPFVSIPLNHVIKLERGTYSCKVTRVNLARDQHACADEPPSH
mmetsp:Transcript_9627/g.16911  ORF Transcript_9627/g.16911 Transcript_9627/m.16911 type:complete len:485 (+) Transcript_9627:257-1711(+)